MKIQHKLALVGLLIAIAFAGRFVAIQANEPEPAEQGTEKTEAPAASDEKAEPATTEDDDPSKPKTVKLTLSPAKVPRRPLEPALWPAKLDTTEGNAQPVYATAMLMMVDDKGKFTAAHADWLETPLKKLPVAEVKDLLGQFAQPLKMVRIAARRTRCEWEGTMRDWGKFPFDMVLPDLNPSRELARLLALSARLNIAQGNYKAAVEDLSTGYRMAWHYSQQDYLISTLVGVAIAAMMDEQLIELMQAKDAPSLYWPLTAMPKPLLKLHDSMATEASVCRLMFPEIYDARSTSYSDAQWEKIREEVLALVESAAGKKLTFAQRTASKFADLSAAPAMRKSLVERGFDAKRVEAMSASQVLMIGMIEDYEEQAQHLFKLFNLPYWQAKELLAAEDRKIKLSAQKKTHIPRLASFLLFGLQAAMSGTTSAEARYEGIRVIEALRLYAGSHEGKLPEKLGDLERTPVSINPVTGKPFEYSYDPKTETAVLVLDSPTPARPTIRYEIRIRKK